MKALRRWLPPVILVTVLIGLWQLAASSGFMADALGLESFLVPSPAEIADALWIDRYLLAENAWVTFYEIVAGFSVALLTVLLAAFALSRSRLPMSAGYPWLSPPRRFR